MDDETYLLFASETYLGDGLYVQFDGYQFIFRAPREHGDHRIGLDPDVLRAFDEFRKCIDRVLRADG